MHFVTVTECEKNKLRSTAANSQCCRVCLESLPHSKSCEGGKAQLVAATGLPPFRAFTRLRVGNWCNAMKTRRTVGIGNGNGYVLIIVAVAKTLAALYGRKERRRATITGRKPKRGW